LGFDHLIVYAPTPPFLLSPSRLCWFHCLLFFCHPFPLFARPGKIIRSCFFLSRLILCRDQPSFEVSTHSGFIFPARLFFPLSLCACTPRGNFRCHVLFRAFPIYPIFPPPHASLYACSQLPPAPVLRFFVLLPSTTLFSDLIMPPYPFPMLLALVPSLFPGSFPTYCCQW